MTTPTPDWDAVIDELNTNWCKGSLGLPHAQNGPVCLRGAVMRVTGLTQGDVVRVIEETYLDPILVEQFPDRAVVLNTPGVEPVWVPRFNDHEDTTLDDVILVCEKARAASPVL